MRHSRLPIEGYWEGNLPVRHNLLPIEEGLRSSHQDLLSGLLHNQDPEDR